MEFIAYNDRQPALPLVLLDLRATIFLIVYSVNPHSGIYKLITFDYPNLCFYATSIT